MEELATVAVGAEVILMVLLAQFGLVVFGHVRFLLEFMHSMREGTMVFEFAEAVLGEVLTHLRFVFHFERVSILLAVLITTHCALIQWT